MNPNGFLKKKENYYSNINISLQLQGVISLHISVGRNET